MRSSFTFYFDNSKEIFCRMYKFYMEFPDKLAYEKALDWAETSNDISEFISEMEGRYGLHEVNYSPEKDFYGFESGNISPKNYISVMEAWKDFFTEHNIECGEITEVIDDNKII